MSIKILHQTATRNDLQKVGPVPVPLSSPACEIHNLPVEITGKPQCSTGLWECSPGKFARQVEEAEVMHILSGQCTFTPENSDTPLAIQAGDTLFFPAHTRGVWDISETVRKVYVLV